MDRGRKFLEDDQRDPSGTMRSRTKSKGISVQRQRRDDEIMLSAKGSRKSPGEIFA